MLNIVTYTISDHLNYGNRLQNYALNHFLKYYFIDCEVYTIWRKNLYQLLNRKYMSLSNIRRYIFNRHNCRKNFDKNLFLYDVIKEYNIEKFNQKNINRIFNLDNNYDYFIAGSDQIWNPNYVDLKNAFLPFADRNKRIAYAASFGVSKIPDDKIEIVKKGLEGMNYISVREHAGANIVKELIGRTVPVLVDPTMLLTADEWKKLAERPVWYRDEKFILVYFLSKLPDKIKSDIQHLAERYKLKIVDLMDKENIDYFCSPPRVNFCS